MPYRLPATLLVLAGLSAAPFTAAQIAEEVADELANPLADATEASAARAVWVVSDFTLRAAGPKGLSSTGDLLSVRDSRGRDATFLCLPDPKGGESASFALISRDDTPVGDKFRDYIAGGYLYQGRSYNGTMTFNGRDYEMGKVRVGNAMNTLQVLQPGAVRNLYRAIATGAAVSIDLPGSRDVDLATVPTNAAFTSFGASCGLGKAPGTTP